jgi:hypothetical protein
MTFGIDFLGAESANCANDMVPQQSIGRHDGLVIKCNLLHDFDIAVSMRLGK